MGQNNNLKSDYLAHGALPAQRSRLLSTFQPLLLRMLFSLTLLIITFIIYIKPLFQTLDSQNANPFSQVPGNGPPLSCSPEANFTDPCLVEKPCGLVLLAQMYDHKSGPIDSWSIHGLWGNFCDGQFIAPNVVWHSMLTHEGSYPASCEPSREVDDIPAILRENRELFLLNYMTFNWPVRPPPPLPLSQRIF
jgi:hypothetical protein